MNKGNYLLGLKVVAWILAGYLFVNLTLYILGMINNAVFWGSLILIAILNAWVIPRIRKKFEQPEEH